MSEQQVDMHSFAVSLCSDDGELKTLWLPQIPDGVYCISDESEYHFLRIEGVDGQWVARCIQPAFFQKVSIQNYNQIKLTDDQYLSIDYEDKGYSLFTQKASSGNTTFKNYTVPSEVEISIGSKSSSDICYDNQYISKRHALLVRTNRLWHVQDLGSDSGVYLNGHRVNSATLRLGDVLFIMGMRIIIGTDFISINNGDGRIGINHRLLKDATLVAAGGYSRYSGENLGEVTDRYFNRAPRKRQELKAKTIEIEGPPMSMEKAQMPLMLRMGSSMVMGGTAALAGNYTMLLSSVLFPLLSSKFTDKQRQDYEQLRKTKYAEYLEARRKEIIDACTEELQLLNKKYPNLSAVADQMQQKQRLWERRPGDDDFLQLRLGSGNRPLSAVISYPEKRFGLEEDPLEEKMYQLAEKRYLLKDAPVLLSLIDTTVCGLKGERGQIINYILQLVMQTAVFHSYDEVKMVFLLNQEELGRFDCIRYLPHTWDDLRSVRFIATSQAEAYRIGDYLKGQLQDAETERELNEILRNRPYYLVYALDKKLLDGHEFFKETLQSTRNNGISIVVAGDELPKETQTIITLTGEQKNTCTALGTNGGEDTCFAMDYCNPQQIDATMRMLANTSLKAVAQAQAMPKTITFLEMYQCGRIEQLNPLQRWRENNPVSSLAAPVGVGADGSLFMLDLHEKRQGPHGLVAGMTGSGKSEFIITYILSMAVNYHPDEVAFVLIDYKGGGLASAFDNPKTGMHLPHLVGTITNLDGASIQRSLMSIESELIRRQKVFSEVTSTTNEGTMDIYTYQKLYRAGKVSKPMPHLFIVSDEFAELKQQQPDFMTKLISAARIGRSLGVHLILATQKPSGVVDDQIRSNTKFRVCLRVQDRSDSMDMLKRADAAELTDTGRFYLQVGYNEYFAMGQSAWCGAAYEPQDKVIVQRDDTIEFLNTTGEIIVKAKPKVKKTDSGVKQIVAIVQHLSDLAKSLQIAPKLLWEKPLATQIDLNELKQSQSGSRDTLQALVGMVDNPAQQAKFPLYLDMKHNRNLLIAGESGSGKTTFIQTLLYDLANENSSEEIQFFIFDFSSRNLSAFKNLPHCGAVVTDDEEALVSKVLSLIENIVKERRNLFAAAEVSSYDAYLEIEQIPVVLLVVDNLTRIEEMKERSDIYARIEDLMSNGIGYGIKVVYTISQINTCPIRIRRNTGSKIALRARDRIAYSDILDCRCRYEPPDIPGRGMCVVGEDCCEFQVAVAGAANSEQERIKQIRQRIREITQRPENIKQARRLEVLDENQTYEAFCNLFEKGRIPLGFNLDTMEKVAMPMQQLYCTSLFFGNMQGVEPILKNFLFAFQREQAEILIVPRKENSVLSGAPLSQFMASNVCVLQNTQEGIERLLARLTEIVTVNKVHRNVYCTEQGVDDWKHSSAVKKWRRYVRSKTRPVFVLFESLLDTAACLSVEKAATLGAYFRCCLGYNIYFYAGFYSDDEVRMDALKYPNGKENASKDENSIECIRAKELRHVWEGLLATYNLDSFVLLYGGQFHKQKLVSLPTQWSKIKKPCSLENIDKMLMHYRGAVYSMSMPCEKVVVHSDDIDELDIVCTSEK